MNKEFIIKQGLIVVLRDIPKEKIIDTVTALYKGGVEVVELAFNASDENTTIKTASLIKMIGEKFKGKMLIGAGTVIKPEYLNAAFNAGADFIVSPDTNIEIIKQTKQLGLLSIAGALTPSECTTAFNNGADLIKLFPITVNDLGYLKNITKPLSHIPFLCFGGTNIQTAPLFIKAGAVGVGTGSTLLKAELIENEDYEEITNQAKMLLEEIQKAKRQKGND